MVARTHGLAVVPFAHIVGVHSRCIGCGRNCKSSEAVLARLTDGPCGCNCEVAEPIVLLVQGRWRRWGGSKVAEPIVLLVLGRWRRWGGSKVAEPIVLLVLGCWRRYGRSGLGERARKAGFVW